jgi:hypothetical protein
VNAETQALKAKLIVLLRVLFLSLSCHESPCPKSLKDPAGLRVFVAQRQTNTVKMEVIKMSKLHLGLEALRGEVQPSGKLNKMLSKTLDSSQNMIVAYAWTAKAKLPEQKGGKFYDISLYD